MRRSPLPPLVPLLVLIACRAEPQAREQPPSKPASAPAEPAATGDRPPGAATTADVELGASTTAPVREAMAKLTELEAALAGDGPIDVAAARAAWSGPLADWVAATDVALDRGDAELIAASLARVDELSGADQAEAQRGELLAAVTQVRVAALFELRRLLTAASDADPGQVPAAARAQQWDDAWTIWSAALRPLAVRADALERRGGEDWAATITDAFVEARTRLDDPVAAKASRQIVEKGSYAVAYRLILANAESRDPLAVREAAIVLDQLDDRIADRNGPGLERMRRMLNGDPAAVDAIVIERELAVAFAKRARKYCDKAVIKAELGRPGAIAETWEGVVYTKVILPSMRDALADQGFDADAYAADWLSYLEAVESADADTAAAISARLVEWNCAYQDQLGIAACTASENEPETAQPDGSTGSGGSAGPAGAESAG